MSSTPHSERDRRYMKRAILEARMAYWRTHPNPMVGAVIVDPATDAVLSVGHHQRAGLPHAEVEALRKLADGEAKGAELYCTLEPCHHRARTGPCTEAIIAAGIRRCVIGTVDLDSRVSGRGIEALRAAGIEVAVGVLEAECVALNAPFFTRVAKARPWVTAKVAMSLDGRIATRTGHSQWITGPEARAEVHRMRDRHDAVLVGTGTLVADDPRLTTRLPDASGRPSLRVVLDRTLRAGVERKVYSDEAPTLLVTAESRVDEARAALPEHVDVLGVAEHDGKLDLGTTLAALARREITTVLCEGGGELLASLVEIGVVDRWYSFIAPKLVGGQNAPGPLGGLGVETMDAARTFEIVDTRRFGPDLCVELAPSRAEDEAS